mmetsp:Transcript_16900/g.27814  ORF Transcript_16900/g.27814 Transcript_16900/m.27814 type:complete len:342 (+) Transcript_16900:86-1111(+)
MVDSPDPLSRSDVCSSRSTPSHLGKLYVVLDMDETLIHSEYLPHSASWRVVKRPGLSAFLKSLFNVCELILWTAGTREYAEPIIDKKIDPDKEFFHHRWYRETTTLISGNHVKDLSKLASIGATDPNRIVIVDNQKESFLLHPQNGIRIKAFLGDMRDVALFQLLPFLNKLLTIQDVRVIIQQYCLNEEFKVPRSMREPSMKPAHIHLPHASRSGRLVPLKVAHATVPGELSTAPGHLETTSPTTQSTERSMRPRPFPISLSTSRLLARLPQVPLTPLSAHSSSSSIPSPVTPSSVSPPSPVAPIAPLRLNLQPLSLHPLRLSRLRPSPIKLGATQVLVTS